MEITPSIFNGSPGDQVRLSCRSQPLVGTLIWTKEGLQLLPVHIYVNNGVLTISSARNDDSGRYICTSTDSIGRSVTSAVDVHISGNGGYPQPSGTSPTIKRFDERYNIIQGYDFSIPCEVAGNPHPIVKWTRAHEEFNANTQQNGNILRILNAKPENRGIYTCIAENSAGNTEESTVIEIERKF